MGRSLLTRLCAKTKQEGRDKPIRSAWRLVRMLTSSGRPELKKLQDILGLSLAFEAKLRIAAGKFSNSKAATL